MRTKEEKAVYNKQYRETHKERLADLKKAWFDANPDKKARHNKKWNDKNKEFYKQWHNNNPDRSKAKWLKYRYDITLSDYNKMFEEQEGKCWICSTHISELKYPLQVDHSHITGAVRGLLCNRCNSRLRESCLCNFKYTVKLYAKAIGYITLFNN
jgi:hypothetical protein